MISPHRLTHLAGCRFRRGWGAGRSAVFPYRNLQAGLSEIVIFVQAYGTTEMI